MSKNTDMTTGPVLPLIVRFARPLLLTSILQQMYSMADAIIIRRIAGIGAFAAIGASGALLWVAESMLMGLTQGFGVVYAQLFGAHENGRLGGAFRCGMRIAALFALMFICLLFLLRYRLFVLFATPDELIGDAVAYTVSMLLFLAASSLFYNAAAFLRAVGDSHTPMRATFISSLINITLDLILVGIFHTHTFGAGLASSIAQCIAFAICLRRVRHGYYVCADTAGHIRPLLSMGIPSMIRDGIISMGGGFVQRMVNSFGIAVVAGVAASKKCFTILQTCGSALEGCAATFAGQNTGAGNTKRVKEGIRVLVLTDIVTACMTTAAACILARPLIGSVLGYGDTAALECGIKALRWAAVFLPALYILCTLRACLQNMGFAAMAMGSGFCELLARAAVCTCLPAVAGELSAYIAEEAGWLITMVYLIVCLCAAGKINKARSASAR